MSKISAVISAFNEEENIKRCLGSLKFADEIVVVDNESTDLTVKIAREFTDKIFSQKNNPEQIDIQKNFGFDKASSEWILSLDADEEVTDELAKEIKSVLSKEANKPTVTGYWISRKNLIFDKWIENAGWYPDFQLKLFKKGKGRYTSKHVHEGIKLEGEAKKLKEHIVHHNYTSVLQFINKTTNYAQNEAKDLMEKGYEFSYFDAIKLPLREFLSRFFARKGYKDGFHGLMVSMFMAFYHFLIFAFVWEQRGFSRYEGPDFLKEAEKEFKKSGKEILFWFSKEKIESMKSPFRKMAARFSEKLKSPKL